MSPEAQPARTGTKGDAAGEGEAAKGNTDGGTGTGTAHFAAEGPILPSKGTGIGAGAGGGALSGASRAWNRGGSGSVGSAAGASFSAASAKAAGQGAHPNATSRAHSGGSNDLAAVGGGGPGKRGRGGRNAAHT
eukprot:Selendium_serpulae@DN6143_c2_g2_i1.p4